MFVFNRLPSECGVACTDQYCLRAASELLRLCEGYRPETKAQKKERLTAAASAKAEGKEASDSKKAATLKFGYVLPSDAAHSH
jgi:hypothetical protein